MKIQDYLAKHCDKNKEFWLAPRVKCADGFEMSVQVHAGAYCCPRNGHGPHWESAEIGFPSQRPSDAIMAHAEQPEIPTDTVYGYVPLELIDAEIALHGGIVEEAA